MDSWAWREWGSVRAHQAAPNISVTCLQYTIRLSSFAVGEWMAFFVNYFLFIVFISGGETLIWIQHPFPAGNQK